MRWENSYTHGVLVLRNKDNGKTVSVRVDPDQEDVLKRFRWHPDFDKSTGKYYIRSSRHKMHRFIMKVSDPLCIVDHINRDTTDNRKENLRAGSTRLNLCNRKDNTSGFPGVFWHKRDKYWFAQIMMNGKKVWLGSSREKERAIGLLHSRTGDLFGDKNPYKSTSASAPLGVSA